MQMSKAIASHHYYRKFDTVHLPVKENENYLVRLVSSFEQIWRSAHAKYLTILLERKYRNVSSW